eukprot:10191387-Alexandrium_andersonii.AAC.1
MSASLVGSEMCIRDRHNIRPSITSPADQRAEAQAAWGGAAGRCPRAKHCLLYTSDAADDM